MEVQRSFFHVDVRELSSMIKVPTLVVHTKHDAAVPFEEGRETAACIPGARFTILDSKNHVLMQTEPAWNYFWDEFYRFFGGDVEFTQRKTKASIEDRFWSVLSSREREVLRLLAEGHNNLEISQKLALSEKTIRNYVSNIYEKLQINSRGEAIVLARKLGPKADK